MSASLFPGDFSRLEDERSLQVNPAEGLHVILQSSVGGGGRDAGAVCAQLMYSPAGTQTVYVVSDSRSPSLQAVLAPGQEGRVLRLSSTLQPAEGLTVDLEGAITSAGVPQSAKVGGKWAGGDFLASGSLTLPLERGAPHAELSYHQSLGRGTGCTAGGSLSALLHQPSGAWGPLPDLLPMRAQQVFWGTFGSWSSAERDRAVYVKHCQQPRPDGPPLEATSVVAWNRVSKSLELCADLSCTTEGPFTAPQASGAGVGLRMNFAGTASNQGLSSTLLAHASSELVLGVSLTTPSAPLGTNTFMRSVLTAVLDHKQRDYKTGLSLEFYY